MFCHSCEPHVTLWLYTHIEQCTLTTRLRRRHYFLQLVILDLPHFVTARTTRTSAALGELVLMILCCRTGQLSMSFLPAAVRLWNSLP